MTDVSPLGLREFFSRLPTTDLYLTNPLAKLRQQHRDAPRLRNLAQNIYAVGRTGVIVRYGRAADLDLLRRSGAERIVYVADDDFSAGAGDPNLPERYRRKLAEFAENAWPPLRDAADIVVVPGDVLAALYGAKARIVPPVWHRAPAPSDHFADAPRVEIVHLGTGSHGQDLAPLVPVLAELLDAHPQVRLTLFSGEAAPEVLRNRSQVRVRQPMAWWRYRLALPRMRFHLALYPLADTPFNRARSANKLYEHALTGAASLMSPTAALRAAAGPALSGLFVEGGADEWRARLHGLLASPSALRSQAEATRGYILADDPAGQATDAWGEILKPEL